ncbi:MAG: response regulator [Proteobacteria bacterium]|jgi:two-component system NtrC family sensor kinase|nr:response regulator [Pseudomonadota bacterium]MCG2823049.1 response regulator [Desulfobulbaceae bacterium]MDP2002376.1 response regulator [Desulfurivibrionaceae bacterium]PKN23126.1 MAG: histidine kinase [Deltaproteobacteria bacterium HGW-Deltaproteobacteria-3]
MTENVTILCVDDEANVLKSLRRLFLDEDYEILTAESGQEGLVLLGLHQPVQVVISDYRMPEMDGVAFLKQVHKRLPDTVRIVLSGYADTAAVVAAINEGQIYKFIPKPWNDDELKVTIAKAVERYFLVQANNQLNEELRQANDELSRIAVQLEEKVAERTEELLFQNKVLRHSQVILNTLPMGVVGFDREGMLVQRNRFAEEVLRKFRHSLLGAPAAEVLPPDWGALLAEVQPGKIVSRKLALAGKQFCVQGVMMNEPDGQSGTVLVFACEICGDACRVLDPAAVAGENEEKR